MNEIQKLAQNARDSLSEFCINECYAFCCKKGYLPINSEEVKLIVGDKKEFLEKEGSLKEMINGKYFLTLNSSLDSCPQLKNNMCLIHNHEKRPDTCKEFPIFLSGKKIKISSRCPAKKENKFFKFEKEAKELGYEVVENLFT